LPLNKDEYVINQGELVVS